MAKEKARLILKPLMPLCTKLGNIKSLTMVKKSKVSPISANTKSNEILLLRDNRSLSLDRQDHDYLQARRAVLSSYHLVNDGHVTFPEKMTSSVKGLCREVGTVVRARVSVRVYRFTVGCPWSDNGKMIVFRCYLPHLKSQKKPCMH